MPDQVEDAPLGPTGRRRRGELGRQRRAQRGGSPGEPRLAGEGRRQLVAEAEGEHELGQAGDKAGDAQRPAIRNRHGGSAGAAPKQQLRRFPILFFPYFTYIHQSVVGSRAFLKSFTTGRSSTSR